MSRPAQTSPIDLTMNVNNVCNLKCSYSFQYAPTNLRITNKGDYLSLLVDDTTTPPVIYNDQNYNVLEVRLYHNSLHTYSGGTHADAELVILHTNQNNTKRLNVCIPVMQSSTATSDSTIYFDQIINEVQATANSIGQQTVFNNPTLSLAKFVPMTSYFSYSGTLPWYPGNGDYDYIVFLKDNAINISSQAYTVLQAVTNQHNNIIKTNPYDVFYNATGPVPPQKGDIYIECQPTGEDGEILVPMKMDTGGLMQNDTLKKMFNFTLVKILIGALIMIAIWKLSMKVINGIAMHSVRAAAGVTNVVPK